MTDHEQRYALEVAEHLAAAAAALGVEASWRASHIADYYQRTGGYAAAAHIDALAALLELVRAEAHRTYQLPEETPTD